MQTEAMKYGLDNEIWLSKSSDKELSGAQVKVFKCDLMIHPDIYWIGCLPDGIFMILMRIHLLEFWKLRAYFQ